MAIVAMVVALVSAMPHHEIIVFFGQNHVALLVQFHLRRFRFVVAGVAILAGGVSILADQFSRVRAHGHDIGEGGIDERHFAQRFWMAPEVRPERFNQR